MKDAELDKFVSVCVCLRSLHLVTFDRAWSDEANLRNSAACACLHMHISERACVCVCLSAVCSAKLNTKAVNTHSP